MLNPTIKFLKTGTRLVLDHTPPALRADLQAALTYTARLTQYARRGRGDDNDNDNGDGAYDRRGRAQVKLVDYQLYTTDIKGRLATLVGCYDRLAALLTKHGYASALVDLRPYPDPSVFVPQWDRLFDSAYNIHLRPGQEACLVSFFDRLALGLPGRIDAAAGFGKSEMIGVIATLLPRARIHYTSKRVAVMRDRIYPGLVGALSDVGLVGGGLHVDGRRVQGYTFESLHHSNGDCDVLICDEVHEACADRAAGSLARIYDQSVNFGFSATHDMRLDHKDMRAEAMFGPVIHRVNYAQAQGAGLVVPIEICWSAVTAEQVGGNPVDGIKDPVERKRWGVWRNQARNRIVAADALRYPDRQVLVTCDTLEHALGLKKELPGFELVYAARDITPYQRRKFESAGVWPVGGPSVMTPERLANLTAAFESGRLRGAIVTTVWNVGVSMNHLEVLCRADAGSSPTNDVQVPGRTSRTNAAIGKTAGRIHDYLDQFDRGFRQRAGRRAASYKANGWRQYQPGQWEALPF